MPNHSERSKCCNAKVKVVGKTTLYYECLKCKQPCDIYFVKRNTWTINPKTRIKGDERIKIRRKEIDRDLRKLE